MLTLLFACVLDESALTPVNSDVSEGSGRDEDASYDASCEETRTTLALDDLPSGFTSTPRDVVEAVAGTWEGTWVPVASEIEDTGVASLTLSTSESAAAVLVDERPIETSSDEGAPDGSSCVPYYEVTIAGTFTAPGLDEALAVAVLAEAGASPTLVGHLPVAEVQGTARPTWESDLAYEWLRIDATMGTSTAQGSAWWVTTDAPETFTDRDRYAMGALIGDFTLERR